MSAEELRRIRLATLGSQVDMYTFMGIKRRTYQDYEAGRRRIPPCVAYCMRLEMAIVQKWHAGIPARVDAAEEKRKIKNNTSIEPVRIEGGIAMGRMKPNPRYNVISCRVADDTKRRVDDALGERTYQDFVAAAIEEKLLREQWAATDPKFAELHFALKRGLNHA